MPWTKEHWKQWRHDYYLKNKDKFKVATQKYKETHRKELAAKQREYNITHNEAIKLYRTNRREELKVIKKTWDSNNKEHTRTYARERMRKLREEVIIAY